MPQHRPQLRPSPKRRQPPIRDPRSKGTPTHEPPPKDNRPSGRNAKIALRTTADQATALRTTADRTTAPRVVVEPVTADSKTPRLAHNRAQSRVKRSKNRTIEAMHIAQEIPEATVCVGALREAP